LTGAVGAAGAVGAVGAIGKKLLDIDYDIYAEGEAVLGWLNAAVRLSTGAAATGDVGGSGQTLLPAGASVPAGPGPRTATAASSGRKIMPAAKPLECGGRARQGGDAALDCPLIAACPCSSQSGVVVPMNRDSATALHRLPATDACALPAADAGAPHADWAGFARKLLEGLRDDFRRRGARVGHVKLLLSAGSEQCIANLTSTDGEVSVRGQAGAADRAETPGRADTAAQAELVLNARVEMSPEELEALVRRHLSAAAAGGVAAEIVHLQSLRPGRPRPTHRYRCVVEP